MLIMKNNMKVTVRGKRLYQFKIKICRMIFRLFKPITRPQTKTILLAIQTTALLAALVRPNHIVYRGSLGALSFAASL